MGIAALSFESLVNSLSTERVTLFYRQDN